MRHTGKILGSWLSPLGGDGEIKPFLLTEFTSFSPGRSLP
jgi:hypothetical protein